MIKLTADNTGEAFYVNPAKVHFIRRDNGGGTVISTGLCFLIVKESMETVEMLLRP